MIKVVPDSSFYICFIDDINKPEYLAKILIHEFFTFVIGEKVKKEIMKSPHYSAIREILCNHTQYFEYYNYGEILRPFFSLDEIKKGEHEVIAISYILYLHKNTFIAILDDCAGRKFIDCNLPQISKNVTGTVGFIKLCYCNYHVFSKKETITILNLIKSSRFRVEEEVVDETLKEIERC